MRTRKSHANRIAQEIRTLVSVGACMFVVFSAHAQSTTVDLRKVSGREYVDLCAHRENADACLAAVYGRSTVNTLLDAIYKQTTYCPPPARQFPPPDIVGRVSAWLKSNPALLNKRSEEALSEALKSMYPCR